MFNDLAKVEKKLKQRCLIIRMSPIVFMGLVFMYFWFSY